MTDFTVADVLRARPSLKERAKESYRIAYEAEEQRRRDEEQDLTVLICEWLVREAQCSQAEIEDLKFTYDSFSSNGTSRQVTVKLDGLTFRARFDKDDLRVDLQGRSGNSWTQVKCLADVGKVWA